MKNLLKFSALALFAAVGAFVLTGANPTAVIAQEEEQVPVIQTEEQPAEEQPTEENQEQPEEQPAEEQQAETTSERSPYTYVAQPGDSYTKIARKAVQTYGFNKNVSLSLAEIVAAETFLTSDAGFPELNVGQEVSISEADVEAAVKKAQDLDDATEALWERFVPFVDFNTNNVGEARE